MRDLNGEAKLARVCEGFTWHNNPTASAAFRLDFEELAQQTLNRKRWIGADVVRRSVSGVRGTGEGSRSEGL